jgi:hypothetical protein
MDGAYAKHGAFALFRSDSMRTEFVETYREKRRVTAEGNEIAGGDNLGGPSR